MDNFLYSFYESVSETKLIHIATIFLLCIIHQYKENNYGIFLDRIKSIFSLSSIIRYIRYSLVVNLVILLFKIIFFKADFNNFDFTNELLDYSYDFIYQTILQFIIIIIVIYFLNKRNIKVKILKGGEFYKERQSAIIQFILFSVINLILFFVALFLTSVLVYWLNSILISNAFYPYSLSDKVSIFNELVAYKRGVYLSIFISIVITLIFVNALYKKLSWNNNIIDIIIYLFMISICALGIYVGLYACLNAWQNYNQLENFNELLTKDKIIGNLSIRLSACFVAFGIIKFIVTKLFKGDYTGLLSKGIGITEQERHFRSELGNYSSKGANYFDIFFFNQIGFYIINIFVAEFLVSTGHYTVIGATILFAILPVMVDDYLAIHYYFEILSKMHWWHRLKLIGLNIALFIFSVIALFQSNYNGLLTTYIVLCFVFLISYFLNYLNKID